MQKLTKAYSNSYLGQGILGKKFVQVNFMEKPWGTHEGEEPRAVPTAEPYTVFLSMPREWYEGSLSFCRQMASSPRYTRSM